MNPNILWKYKRSRIVKITLIKEEEFKLSAFKTHYKVILIM